MRIIFSRKGFDAENGGVPSPIFPDGRMVSLPIPRKSPLAYSDINSPKREFSHLGEIVEYLSGFRLSDSCRAHLDPDLDFGSITREEGWRGIFGQSATAQRELEKADVGKGSLFLFFGQFRRVEVESKRGLRYATGSPVEQVLFGWLLVGEIYRLPGDVSQVPNWARYHPHLNFAKIEPVPNVIYIAKEKLDANANVPGWGVFPYFQKELRLTHPVPLADKKGKLRAAPSRWQLPAWMHPWKDAGSPRPPLTHHPRQASWIGSGDDQAILQTQPRGQEFILDANSYPEAWAWAVGLIEQCSTYHQ